MKSSCELAMERMGGEPMAKLTDEQKAKIAETESLHKSRKVQAEMAMQEKIKNAGGDPDAIKRVMDDYTVEVASIESKLESEKNAIRKGV